MSVQVGMDDYLRFRDWAKTADRKIAAAQRKRLRAIGQEMAGELAAAGAEGMPASGGLQSHLAESKAGLQMLASGVRLRLGARGAGIGLIDRKGVVRHPVYGHRSAWSSTDVEPGTWTKAFEERAQQAREQLVDELQDIIREVGA